MTNIQRRIVAAVFIFFVAVWGVTEASAKLRVVTSLPDFASITLSVGGDYVEVFSIMRGGQDPHFVDPKPSFLRRLSQADAVIVAGLELDQWMDLLIEQSRNSRILRGQPGYINASAGIDLLEVQKGSIDRSQGDIHPYGNPHYWLDPHNGIIIAQNIANRLSRLDPEHAAAYEKNARDFGAALEKRIPEWKKRFAVIEDRRVVSYHNSWAYFAKAFGLTVAGYVEPKPGITPPPAHIYDLIQMMKKSSIRVIVKEPYFSNSLPDKIANDAGATVLNLTQSVGGLPGIDNYLDLFEVNTRLLSEALGRE